MTMDFEFEDVDQDMLDDGISKAFNMNNHTAVQFFESLKESLEKWGKLSPKQKAAFYKFYERLR